MRDLLIKMMLDTSDYKTAMKAARDDAKLLASELRAVESDKSLEDASGKTLEILKQKADDARAQISSAKEGLDQIAQKLTEAVPGSQNEKSLVNQATKLQIDLNNAQANLNGIEEKINTIKMDNMLNQAQQLSTLFMNMRLGFGDALDFFGDAADSADGINVSRESAWTGVTKILNDRAEYTEEWGKALNEWNREVIQRIPVTYEELADIEAMALQAAGVSTQGLREFTETFAALQAATNLQGEAGVLNFGKYATVIGATEDEYHRLGSVVVALGNNFAAMEDQIVNTAQKSASALKAAGFTAAEGLAYSTAAVALGMNDAAAGTSLEKTTARFAKAVEAGQGAYYELIQLKEKWDETQDEMDEAAYKSMLEQLKLDASDYGKIETQYENLEKFAEIMGTTPAKLAEAYTSDAAGTIVDFYAAIYRLTEEENEGLLTFLDTIGISEVRAARLARNFTLNADVLGGALDIARQAYQEDKALDEEAQRRYATTESQRTMNANKAENAAEAMGQYVTSMRRPWDNFFGDLQQWFAEWPEWAQVAVGGASQVLGAAGDVLDWMGNVSFAAVNITNALKMLQQMGAGAKLASAAATAGKVLGGAAIAGAAGLGLYELGVFIGDLADHTDEIANKLSGLEITIDPVSKEATLAAIREVKEAAEGLGGGDMEKYAAASRTVQMGFGTSGMFGQALAYEQYQAEKALEEIYTRYGGVISRYEQNLVASEGDALAQANWQKNIESATAEMEREAAAARAAYGETMNRVLNGAIQQAGGTELLEGISEQYRALDLLYAAYNEYVDNGKKANFRPENWEALSAAMEGAGFNMKAMLNSSRNNVQEGQYKQMAEFIWGQLADAVGDASQNGALMNILASALTSGALENADQSAFSGAFLGLLEAMDAKAIAETGVKNWQDIGKNSMIGLGQGITDNQGEATDAAKKAAQDVTAAAAAALGVQSPSTVFEAIGENIDLGLANGIYARADEAIAAASWLAAQVESAMRSALDINSPSGVAKRMGVFLGEGLAQGIEGSLGRVERAAGSLASGVSAAGNRNIDVTLNLDGKTLTQMIVPMMDQALGEQLWQQ